MTEQEKNDKKKYIRSYCVYLNTRDQKYTGLVFSLGIGERMRSKSCRNEKLSFHI